MGRFTKWLNLDAPRTGRVLKENGEFFNESDANFLSDLDDQTKASFRGKAYILSDVRTDIAASNVYYYSFKAPADKHIVVYARSISAGDAPVVSEIVAGATFTPGAAWTPTNLFTGGAASTFVATRGATAVSGGVTIPNDYLFSAGNKQAVAASSQIPTILPPDAELLIKLTNLSLGVNPGIRLAIVFSEITIPDDLI